MKNFVKTILAACLCAVCTFSLNAQGVGINDDASAPDNSAMLDVSSISKGFLPPRMTTAQRDLINSPVAGLTIFNTTKLCNETYNGTVWVTNTHYIGESYGGGIVFYVYDNSQHGLIAATADQGSYIWYAGTNTNTMALADGVGAGRANTAIIIANQGIGNGSAYAARVCNEYQVNIAGVIYGDWYLPSKYELNLLYLQKGVVGGFPNAYYWSSCEFDSTLARIQFFGNGFQGNGLKGTAYYVRAIRAF
jgi:hypothetical protein